MQKRNPSRRRGVILVMTLFFMILFAFLAVALYTLTPNEVSRSARERTLTEAHYACTAGIRFVRTWVSACTAPSIADSSTIEYLGDAWGTAPGAVSAGTTSYARVNNDPFSVPAGDPNFTQTSLNSLTCPKGKVPGSGLEFLGLQQNYNLTPADYTAMHNERNNWLALRSSNPIVVGDYQVYTYVLPSANTMEMLRGNIANGLRAYLVTSVAYRSNEPMLRARCLFKEQSSADYAYRNNSGATDAMNQPITFRVSNPSDKLFDGPVHTNGVPYFTVNSGYWDAPAVADPDNPTNKIRAIKGTLTFSGTNPSLTPAFDGVGWEGGNYNGGSDASRPYNATGTPHASSAGAGPNRYDRFIEGGRSSIKKTSTVALPADLTILKTAAFGSDTVTGLSSASNQVSPNQLAGSVQTLTVTRPAYRASNGNPVAPQVVTNNPDAGIFINTKSGTSNAAGGVVVKGDTRAMILEVTNNGPTGTDPYRIEDNVTTLEDGTATGNPTIRVQTTRVSYDTNLTQDQTSYVQSGTRTVWDVPYSPRRYGADRTVTAHGIPGCPSPTRTGGGGAGAGGYTYSCPHTRQVRGDELFQSRQVPNWVPGPPVAAPLEYRPVDWAVDVKNADLKIPVAASFTNDAWKTGVGGNMQNSSMNPWDSKEAPSLNISKVFLHEGNSATGTLITNAADPRLSIPKTSGKVVLFKQSRSDSTRLDVFVIDKPTDKNYSLNGAVYGTGDINGLRGVNMDRKTIGTDYGNPADPAQGKGIAISDSLWQYGTIRGRKPNNAFHGLGLVASKMNVQTDDRVYSPTTPLRVYATIIAGKGGGSQGMNVSRLNGDTGTNWGRIADTTGSYASGNNPLLQIMGGLTEQQTKARLLGLRGFSQSMLFDQQLSYNPPPFFPATNLLQPMSYSQERL